MSQSLKAPDWSEIPTPEDDGAADHLTGVSLPVLVMPATIGGHIDLMQLTGTTVFYVYPMTGPASGELPDGWNDIPGARGCTPQSCAFRDHYDDLRQAGASRVFGLSTQSTEYQLEAANRLHLPFPLLSDEDLGFADALRLPRFVVDGKTLLKRITLITRAGRIAKIFYPVFPPDQDASNVLNWLKENP